MTDRKHLTIALLDLTSRPYPLPNDKMLKVVRPESILTSRRQIKYSLGKGIFPLSPPCLQKHYY